MACGPCALSLLEAYILLGMFFFHIFQVNNFIYNFPKRRGVTLIMIN